MAIMYTVYLECSLFPGTLRAHDTQGVNTINVFLDKKDKVWIQTQKSGKVEGDNTMNRYTSFSGHMLYRR